MNGVDCQLIESADLDRYVRSICPKEDRNCTMWQVSEESAQPLKNSGCEWYHVLTCDILYDGMYCKQEALYRTLLHDLEVLAAKHRQAGTIHLADTRPRPAKKSFSFNATECLALPSARQLPESRHTLFESACTP